MTTVTIYPTGKLAPEVRDDGRRVEVMFTLRDVGGEDVCHLIMTPEQMIDFAMTAHSTAKAIQQLRRDVGR